MIVITGSLGFDYIMDYPGRFVDRIMPDKIHQISLSFLVDDLKKQWGGTAGNISYTLGLLGIRSALFATAGNDFGQYKKYLEKTSVNTSYVKEIKNIATGSYFVITDQSDNQIGAFYTGAMRYAHNLSLKKIQEKIDLVVIAPNDPAAMRRFVLECQEMHIPYLYDPAFQIGHLTKADLMRGVLKAHILVGNDYEIALIMDKLHFTKEQLLKRSGIIITTLGDKGARIEDLASGVYEEMIIKPAKPKNSSDPTGAGDCFRAGFLAGFLRGFDLQTCGQMGALAAVYTVEKYGTTTHIFTKKEFAKRYKENYRTEISL